MEKAKTNTRQRGYPIILIFHFFVENGQNRKMSEKTCLDNKIIFLKP